jgi:hypothetical protein
MTHDPTRALVPPPGWLRGAQDGPRGVPARFVWAATLLAAVVRLVGLTAQSLWVDEIITWRAVRPDAGLVLLEQLRDAIQGPLYLAVIWPLVRLGDPEVMLRLPAAVAGILTVPAFAWTAGRLVGPRTARLAVLLVAVNPFLVWYSQEARGYAFAVLFAVLMTGAFLAMLEKGVGGGRAALLAITSAAAIWSNMSALFLWAALGLTLLVRLPRDRRSLLLWAAAFAGGLAAAMPWLLQASGIWAVDRILPGADTGAALRGETTFSPLALVYTVFSFFYGFSYGPSLADLHQAHRLELVRAAWPWLAAGAAPVAVGCLVGAVRSGRRRWPLLVWIAVPVAILALLALRNIKPWNARYLAVALPWVLVLAASGLTSLPRRPGAILTILLFGCTLVSLANHHLDERYAREDIRGAAAWVARQPDGGRPVLVPVVTGVWKFYARGDAPVLDTFGRPPISSAAEADALVAEELAGRHRAWIVVAREWDFDPGHRLPDALARAGRLSLAHTRPGVRIYAWQRTHGEGGTVGAH